MAPHSSTLAWKIPWMEEPGRLQSMGLLESDMTATHQPPLSMGILQARILEWVAMPSSRGSSQHRSPALQADSLPLEPPGYLSW